VRAAKNYLDYTAFSHGALISQLEYDGYTSAQAEYGVAAVGL
jgi:Host cell surface-exposed lipoprotein